MRITHAPRTCGVRGRSAFAARRKVNVPQRGPRRRCTSTSSAEQSDTQTASELSRVFSAMQSQLQQSFTSGLTPAAQPTLLVRSSILTR